MPAVFSSYAKWAGKESNPALQDVLGKVMELNHTWWEAQDLLNARLKDFRRALDTILGVLPGAASARHGAQTRNTTSTRQRSSTRLH